MDNSRTKNPFRSMVAKGMSVPVQAKPTVCPSAVDKVQPTSPEVTSEEPSTLINALGKENQALNDGVSSGSTATWNDSTMVVRPSTTQSPRTPVACTKASDENGRLRLALHTASREAEALAAALKSRESEIEALALELKSMRAAAANATTTESPEKERTEDTATASTPQLERDLRARRATVVGLQSPLRNKRPARYSLCAPAQDRSDPLADASKRGQPLPARDSGEGFDFSSRISLKHRQSLDVGGGRRFRVHQAHKQSLAALASPVNQPADSDTSQLESPTTSDVAKRAAEQHGPQAFFEFCRISAGKSLVDTPPAVVEAAAETGVMSASVCQRWVRGEWDYQASTCAPGAGEDAYAVPLLHQCAFPNGVPLRLLTAFEAKRFGQQSASPAISSAGVQELNATMAYQQRAHVLQFPQPHTQGANPFEDPPLLHAAVVAYPVLLHLPPPPPPRNSADGSSSSRVLHPLVVALKKCLVRDLAAATITNFVRQSGGAASFAAYWQVNMQRQRLLYSSSSAAAFATPMRAAAFFNSFRRAPSQQPPDSAINMMDFHSSSAPLEPSNATISSNAPIPPLETPTVARSELQLPLPALPPDSAGPSNDGDASAAVAALAVKKSEWRRRARSVLWACEWGGMVCAAGEEALALVSTHGHAHGALLRVLEAIAEKTRRPESGVTAAAAVAARAAVAAAATSASLSDPASEQIEAVPSMASFFADAQGDFTDSEGESDGDEMSPMPAPSLLPQNLPSIEAENTGVENTRKEKKRASMARLSMGGASSSQAAKTRRQARLGAFLEAAARSGVPQAPGVGGSWQLKWPKLDVCLFAELSPASVEEWQLGVLFSVVPSTALVHVLHVLLCEGKVAVECPDLGLLGAVTAALPYLLHPLKWVGVHIPVKPQGIPAEELLQCPNPFVIGVLDRTKGGNRTLKASRQCPRSGGQEPPPEDVAMLRVGYGAAAGSDDGAIFQCGPEVQGANIVGNQSLAAQLDHAFAGTVNRSNGGSGSSSKIATMGSLCGARGRSKRGAAACAHAYALGLTSNELAAVKRVQGVLSSYVTSLMGDAQTSWNSYGEMNEATGEFEFIPTRFLEPRQTALALQTELAHSQMFHTSIACFKHKQEEETRRAVGNS